MQMPAISRRRAIAYLAVVVLLLALGGKLVLDRRGRTPDAKPTAAVAALVAESGAAAPAPALVVHVAGAVRRPGLYRLEEGSRVNDAIRKAGGARPKAALELVNLAAPVSDGQQVVVPFRSGAGQAVASPLAPGGTSGPVSLNSATLEQLDALPGVGPVTAQKIIDYRTANGSFQTVDELDAVPGIGPARLEELRDLVVP